MNSNLFNVELTGKITLFPREKDHSVTISIEHCKLYKYLMRRFESSPENEIEVRLSSISSETLELVVEYLELWKAQAPSRIHIPIHGVTLESIFDSSVEIAFAKKIPKNKIVPLANAGWILECENLVNFACSLVAKDLRGCDKEQIEKLLTTFD